MIRGNFIDRAKRRDRLAHWLITGGGLLVIASVIGILVLIARVAFPLFLPPSARQSAEVHLAPIDNSDTLAIGVDDYLDTAYLINGTGTITFVSLADGSVRERLKLRPTSSSAILSLHQGEKHRYDILWQDGRFTTILVALSSAVVDGKRTSSQSVTTEADIAPKSGEIPRTSLRRITDGENSIRVNLFAANRLEVEQQLVQSDFLGNSTSQRHQLSLPVPAGGTISALCLDQGGHYLYAGTDQGELLRWDLSTPGAAPLLDQLKPAASGHKITALALVLGDLSLAVADDQGNISTWFPVSSEGSSYKQLALIHRLSPLDTSIQAIIPSQRDKSLLLVSANGTLQISHTTSERTLLTLNGKKPLQLVALSDRGNGLVALDQQGKLTSWHLQIPHPEVSFSTLFRRVWYESYDEPALVWQSSAANDDFEPKFSLTPLIFGTLKGTLYAMLFAVPLALLAALYTSQFMAPRLKGVVKPSVEIMAAIPSVVVGFLAGLWLAPLLDRNVAPLAVSFVVFPALLLVVILLWSLLRKRHGIERRLRGQEVFLFLPVLLAATYVSFKAGHWLEGMLPGKDAKLWLFDTLGARYDQRNSLVISFALGFAVIPLIFTMAEDALSNVPRRLAAASLALGASRWQTAWRVVLPSALPGIFSAVMIGFGRAIGETMIVLMATGNTPIISGSPFNGFRSLSANIAVEIPEAPVGGTLFRILFLSAVLLFLFTFFINTLAEILRQQFRKKYGRF
jgi:phosphate transport system permease protein